VNQQEPSTETSGLGERRRRREAERAARLAAEKAGQAQPLTRRELRRRQLEEQARLEAIATGELPLVDQDGRPLSPEAAARVAHDGVAAPTAEPQAADQPPAPSAADRVPELAERGERSTPTPEEPPPAEQAEEPELPAAAARSRRSMRDRVASAAGAENDPGERTATTRRPVVRAPHTAKGVRSLDSTGALTGVRPVQAPPVPARPGPAAPEPPVTTDPAGWEAAAAFPAPRFPSVPDDSTIVIDAVPTHETGPGRPTSAGTALTPASAVSARSASTPEPPPTTPGPVPTPTSAASAPSEPQATAPGPGPVFAPVRREPTEAERARSAGSPARFPSAASGPEAVAAAALDSDEKTDEDGFLEARPQWASLAEFSAATSDSPAEPDEGATPGVDRREPVRRSVRDRMGESAGSSSARSAEEPEESGYVDDIETRNPAASLIKIVALVLAAVVIGLLIGLLAFNQGDDGASMRIQSLPVAVAALVGHNP